MTPINFSIRKPLTKTEHVVYKSNEYDFPTTALGQTPEIAKALRKLNRNRLIRFMERVDAFTGQYPPSLPVKKRKEVQPLTLGKKALARVIAGSPALFALLKEHQLTHKKISTKPCHDEEGDGAAVMRELRWENPDDRMALKYREVCKRLEARKLT